MKSDHGVLLCCVVASLCCTIVKCRFVDRNIFEENVAKNDPDHEEDNFLDVLTKDSHPDKALFGHREYYYRSSLKNTNENGDTECTCGENSIKCIVAKGKKTCECEEGYADDNKGNCKECDCGNNTESCKFSYEKKVCTCSKDFALNQGKCEECKCGERATHCRFEKGKKICRCNAGSSMKDGICEECECGAKSTGCTFEGDVKECVCKPYYGQKGETCEECQCGEKGTGCSFEGDDKKCVCKEGYAQKGEICEVCKCDDKNSKPCRFDGEEKKCDCKDKFVLKNGNCKATCSEDGDCENGATCGPEDGHLFCKCIDGTTGDKCETVTDCEPGGKHGECFVYRGDCVFDVDKKEAICNCSEKQVYDPKEGYCQDECESNDDCSEERICSNKNYCTCEEGKKGLYCEINTGCTEELEKNCTEAGAVCDFDKNAPQYATCRCTNEEFIYNETIGKCIVKFCYNIDCRDSAVCKFNENNKIAYCDCPNGKYYDYSSQSCREPNKCLLKKTPCKENEVCENGKCICEGDVEEDMCIIKFCKPDSCFTNATCSDIRATCKCEKGKFYDGSGCKDKGVFIEKKMCASKELTDDLSKCKCTGKFKQAGDGITCELVTCDDDVAKSDCKSKGATCQMKWTGNSAGYKCVCPTGYVLDNEKGICTDPCSVYENMLQCSMTNQACYNSYSTPDKDSFICDCSPPFKSNQNSCTELATFLYLIRDIPVVKEKYEMQNGIDYVKLNSHLAEALSQMFDKTTFDSGYLHEYKVEGDVLLCSVWVRLNRNAIEELRRFKLQTQSFPNGTCEDCDTNLYLWPPQVLLDKERIDKVRAETLSLCQLKDQMCGKEAACKDNKCYCPAGYRALGYTIRNIGKDARLLRCEEIQKVDFDECALGTHECSKNTTCFKIPGSYICKCKPGYRKSTENDRKGCVDLCTPSPCEKGNCSMKKGNFNCKCEPGYSGSLCDEHDENFAALKAAKKTTVVVGSVLGTTLTLKALVVILIYLKKRKSKHSEGVLPAPRRGIASEMRESRPIRGVANRSYE